MRECEFLLYSSELIFAPISRADQGESRGYLLTSLRGITSPVAQKALRARFSREARFSRRKSRRRPRRLFDAFYNALKITINYRRAHGRVCVPWMHACVYIARTYIYVIHLCVCMSGSHKSRAYSCRYAGHVRGINLPGGGRGGKNCALSSCLLRVRVWK